MSETPAERTTGARASVELLRRNRDFRRLFVASVISLGGDWFLFVALGRPPAGSDRQSDRRGDHDLRPGGPGLPCDPMGGVAGRPPGPAAAHDRLRSGAHGDLRGVPAGGSRQLVARLRAARHAVDLRGGVRPRLVGGVAQRRRPRGPADRQRAQRLAVGHDARGRRGRRWRRRHAVRSQRSVRGRRRVLRGLRDAAARRAPGVFRGPRARRAHRDHGGRPRDRALRPTGSACLGPRVGEVRIRRGGGGAGADRRLREGALPRGRRGVRPARWALAASGR